MYKAHVVTIGTEITSGEVINTNAAWISTQLEHLGCRVHSHVTVRDADQEILDALESVKSGEIVVVTGGLGPTSDDRTRALVARSLGRELEFDSEVWNALTELYRDRGLPLREAHRHQCWFPKTSERLKNPVGTALGFYIEQDKRHHFVLPGPPRELEGMWRQEVELRLKSILPKTELHWHRWTCLGAPESEVAELVEPIIQGTGLEVGYRAQVPYVRVKVHAHPTQHKAIIDSIGSVLKPFVVNTSNEELATELLRVWPGPSLIVADEVTESYLVQNLFKNKSESGRRDLAIECVVGASARHATQAHWRLLKDGEGFVTELNHSSLTLRERQTLPFKASLASERGRRSAGEWSILSVLKAIRSCKS